MEEQIYLPILHFTFELFRKSIPIVGALSPGINIPIMQLESEKHHCYCIRPAYESWKVENHTRPQVIMNHISQTSTFELLCKGKHTSVFKDQTKFHLNLTRYMYRRFRASKTCSSAIRPMIDICPSTIRPRIFLPT